MEGYKEKAKEIMVIGHKNPDTDSICSAICYADLKNKITGTDNYVPKRGLGMSPRFKIYFQFILPMLILVILLVGLGSWGWRALICAAVAVFVWFMARRSSSKSTI